MAVIKMVIPKKYFRSLNKMQKALQMLIEVEKELGIKFQITSKDA